jgi:hypothetical protein
MRCATLTIRDVLKINFVGLKFMEIKKLIGSISIISLFVYGCQIKSDNGAQKLEYELVNDMASTITRIYLRSTNWDWY